MVRHGANLLDAFFGFRGCLRMFAVMAALGGFLTCGLCGLPGLLRWSAVGRNDGPPGTITARQDRTDGMLETASRLIEARARTSRELPSAETGNAMIDRYRDEWGRGLRYEQNSASDFAIRSAGRDGVFDTADDLLNREHSTSIHDSSQSASPPTDLASAMEFLKTPGLYQKDAALKWLVAQKPELDQNQRTAVVEAAIPLLNEHRQKSLAQNALALWAEPGDAPKLLQAAEQAPSNQSDYVDGLVMQLVRLKDEAAVLSLVNHPSGSVRATVAIALNDWHVSDERIAGQSIEDLDHMGRQEAALARLAMMDLHGTQQEDVVSKAKLIMIGGETTRLRALALDLLEKNGQVDTPLLIKAYESQNSVFVREPEFRERVGMALTERPESSVFLLFASQLGNRDRQAAERGVTYLKLMGPAAESYIWPSLRSEDRRQRERAALLLSAIGTADSIPHLERLVDDEATGAQAQAAILDIQSASRQPVAAPDAAPDGGGDGRQGSP